MVKLGEVGVVNCHGRFLQATDAGQMRASKPDRGEAETWVLWQVDWSRRIYALQNSRTKLYLGKHDVKCVRALRQEIGRTEKWTILSGDTHGMPGRIAFRAHDGTIMGSSAPDVLSGCGGEIMAADRVDPGVGAKDVRWPGWFYLRAEGPMTLVEDGLIEAQWSDEPVRPVKQKREEWRTGLRLSEI